MPGGKILWMLNFVELVLKSEYRIKIKVSWDGANNQHATCHHCDQILHLVDAVEDMEMFLIHIGLFLIEGLNRALSGW